MRVGAVIAFCFSATSSVHGWTSLPQSSRPPHFLGTVGRSTSIRGTCHSTKCVALYATNSSLFFAHSSRDSTDTNGQSRRSSSTSLSSSSVSSGSSGSNLLPDIANTNNDDNDNHSPPPMWGQALSEDTKKWNKNAIHMLKGVLFDQLFGGEQTVERAYARFYALETIARMPYFSYVSVLHLMETLGLWRRANYLKVHFAESWNELHHLLIMEELGGNDKWWDRWVAQHVAFGYYWFVVALYIYNPTHAYHLNQMVEEEAYDTYDKFITQHGEYLQQQPAPESAVKYYTGAEDLYLFDTMHHEVVQDFETAERRRPPCKTLLDCFVNVRDDEWEHVKTMAHFQKGAGERYG